MKVERVEPALSCSALTGDGDAELSGFIMQGFIPFEKMTM